MASDWIPIRLDLHDDPAVIAIASACGLDEFGVSGRLLKLWGWANRNLEDGNAKGNAVGVTESWIDRYLSAPNFAAAMLAAGWLVRVGGEASNVLAFPNFERWNSQGAKRRALTARRVARHKNEGNAGGNADGNAQGNASSVSKSVPKEEKRREEYKTPSESSATVAKPRKVADSPHARSVAVFVNSWAAKYGTKYPFADKDAAHVKAILAHLDGDETRFAEVVTRYLADCDTFLSGHTLGLLRSQLAKWLVDPPAGTLGRRGGSLFDHAAKTESRILAQIAEGLAAD